MAVVARVEPGRGTPTFRRAGPCGPPAANAGSMRASTAMMAVITRVEPAAGDEPPPYL